MQHTHIRGNKLHILFIPFPTLDLSSHLVAWHLFYGAYAGSTGADRVPVNIQEKVSLWCGKCLNAVSINDNKGENNNKKARHDEGE